MDTKGGVADEMVTLEIGFKDFEILLLIFFGDFGIIENCNLILVAGNRLVNRGKFLVDFGDVLLASGEKAETVASQEDIPGKKGFRRKLLLFE